MRRAVPAFHLAALCLAAPALCLAQDLGNLAGPLAGTPSSHTPAGRRSLVTYIAEPQVATAHHRSLLEVRLRIADGFHVNSHTPSSDLLLPTVLHLEPAKDLDLGTLEYPAGARYTLPADPSDVLNVYTGTVTLRVPVTAPPGDHTLSGTLRYQACDQAACYPPVSLPIQILFTARP